MKKNVLSVILAIVIILVVGIVAYFLLNGNQEEKSLDLNATSQTL